MAPMRRFSAADQRVGARVAVVPRQHLTSATRRPSSRPRLDHRAQVARGALDPLALGDVVDAALDHQHLRAAGAAGPAAGRSRPCAPRTPRSCESARRAGGARPSTRTGCAGRRRPCCPRTSASGSQAGEPAVIESPSAATSVVSGRCLRAPSARLSADAAASRQQQDQRPDREMATCTSGSPYAGRAKSDARWLGSRDRTQARSKSSKDA